MSMKGTMQSACDARVHLQFPHMLQSVNTSLGSFTLATLHPKLDGVSRGIRASGHWELRDLDDLAASSNEGSTLPSTGVFLDIGANFGYYSFAFAQRQWSVVAIEPMTQNRALMNLTKCRNRPQFDGVRVLPRALGSPEQLVSGDKCTVQTQDLNHLGRGKNAGNGALVCGRDARCSRKNSAFSYLPGHNHFCQEVELSTLDAQLDALGLAALDVVKLDVEGQECNVLAGGERMLFRTMRPALIMVEANLNATDVCARRYARRYGYTVHEMRTWMRDRNLVLARAEARARGKHPRGGHSADEM
jgi:FkbM family methyltransferase